MLRNLDIAHFLQNQDTPILDVRSPGEYIRGHIPGAISFPLFTDTERSEIGTLYKQSGRVAAVLRGLEITGPRMAEMVTQAHFFAGLDKSVRLYCWRGGMRSHALAWLLSTAGFRVQVLEGGYKSWRNYILQVFQRKYNFLVLGGYTGTGKTIILNGLKHRGHQTLDLEALASHKGSSFGSLGMPQQPTQEHFENILAHALLNLDIEKRIWIEDESRMIGRLTLPPAFWDQKISTQVLFLEQDKHLRIEHLVKEYAMYLAAELEASVLRIQKKIGGQRTREALEALKNKNYHQVAEIVLYYYDKAYDKALLSSQFPKKAYRISIQGVGEETLDQVEAAEKRIYFEREIE